MASSRSQHSSSGCNVQTANIPGELCARDQWVAWRYEIRDGKQTKVPLEARSLRHGNVSDHSTWGSFTEAVAALSRDGVDGIGFVFTKSDPYCGIDLDKCRNGETGRIDTWAQEIIDKLKSYSETSPSGTGAHVIVRATLPKGGRRKGPVEMYDNSRFFCMTGHILTGTSGTIEDRQELVEACHRKLIANAHTAFKRPLDSPSASATNHEQLIAAAIAKNKRISKLWNGDWRGYPSQSEADLALCSLLVPLVDGDAARLDRLFRQSKLWRPKWDECHSAEGATYGEITIQKAIASRNKLAKATPTTQSTRPGAPARYRVVNGSFHLVQENQKGDEILRPLCNFEARITKKIEVHDGEETELGNSTRYLIHGSLWNGKALTPIEVPASEIESVNAWLEPPWGPDASVFPGPMHQWHVSTAIKTASGTTGYTREVCHINTGYSASEAEGELFLSSNGAINARGEFVADIKTTPRTQEVGLFVLSPPAATLAEQRAAADMTLRIARPPLALHLQPLVIGGIVRAPLGNCSYGVLLVGTTGVLKTSIASYPLQAFAPNCGWENTPLNFESTVKANLRLAYLLKDVLVVVDDFRSSLPHHLQHAEALLQAIGNQAPRRGLTRDSDMRATEDRPRCFLWMTGEDRITAESATARCLEISVSKRDVPTLETGWPQERDREGRAGIRNKFLSNFIAWLMRSGYRQAQDTFQRRKAEHVARLAAKHPDVHGRTHGAVADLTAALEVLSGYCDELHLHLQLDEWGDVLTEQIGRQTRVQRENNPIERVREILRDGVAARRLYVSANVEQSAPMNHRGGLVSQGSRCIGHVSEDGMTIGLIANEVLAVVRETESKLGRSFGLSPQRFHEMLVERQWMPKSEKKGRNGCPFRCNGQTTYRAVVPTPFLFELEDDEANVR